MWLLWILAAILASGSILLLATLAPAKSPRPPGIPRAIRKSCMQNLHEKERRWSTSSASRGGEWTCECGKVWIHTTGRSSACAWRRKAWRGQAWRRHDTLMKHKQAAKLEAARAEKIAMLEQWHDSWERRQMNETK